MPLHPDLETSWRQLQIEERRSRGRGLTTRLMLRYADSEAQLNAIRKTSPE